MVKHKRKRLTYKQVNIMQHEQRDTEKTINELKKKLRRVHNRAIVANYQILNRIYRLRKRFAKSYSLKDLAEEEVINEIFTYPQVFYIFRIQYFSSYAWEMIDRGKITVGYLCMAISKSNSFQDATNQNKLLDMINSGKLKPTELKIYNSYEIRKKVGINLSEEDEDDMEKFKQRNAINYCKDFKEFIYENLKKLNKNTRKTIRKEIKEILKKLK